MLNGQANVRSCVSRGSQKKNLPDSSVPTTTCLILSPGKAPEHSAHVEQITAVRVCNTCTDLSRAGNDYSIH